MQPDEIELTVDALNTGANQVTKTYSRYEEFQNRTVYMGETHTLAKRDLLGLYRTANKPSGNFKGTAKTAVKFTEDIIVDGVDGIAQLTAPIIVEVSFSIPVGATAADVLRLRQTAIALVDSDDVMDPLNLQLLV